MIENTRIGGEFEREFVNILAKNGFWSHLIVKNAGGQQPADIIAVMGKYHALIDCKAISTGRFPFSRLEDNQRTAMTKFLECGGEPGWFALKMGDTIRMLSYTTVLAVEMQDQHSLNLDEILHGCYTLSLSQWLLRAKEKAYGNNDHQ